MIETGASGKLARRSVVQALLQDRGDLLVIGGLGAPAWDITAAGDDPRNLPLWGGMGGAAVMGLGLALAQPTRPVLVITGDGEMLMGVGSLATIATKQPRNLSILVLDNEHYGETGMQETATRHGVDLAGMAKAAGIADSRRVTTAEEVLALRAAIRAGAGPLFAQIKVDEKSEPLALPPREASILQARMREAILGPAAHLQ
ncbi:thiamine pyrophosphate-dependent enzyme [Paracraurococcus ruber]|uniref:Aldehyde dehydrogenase n=1 Tax=Paracraurococcus ruber TaxID=77675 RepID=A0ABS1CZ56_9PROT|nr:thiamine pyrophosphate-dependent enzyme [Paracraurococcus ruber]MBK1659302.1 aldehyde dehydrogenase [Paracraurococcus ruber]TDG32856.1 aldehyde dehydrogenase [Paracraurococcus ruber]